MLQTIDNFPYLKTLQVGEPFPNEAPGFVVAHSGRDFGNMDTRFGPAKSVRQARSTLRRLTPAEHTYVLWPQNELEFADLTAPPETYQRQMRTTFPGETAVVGDGLITNQPHTGLMLNPGDCLPVAVYQPNTGQLGLIHMGWRGSVGGLHTKMLEHMDFDPQDAVAYIGPGIQQKSYYTPGLQPSQEINPLWRPNILQTETGYYINLAGFARDCLINYGFDAQAIVDSGIDTAADDNQYFSFTRHKQYGEPNGRNGFMVVASA